MRLIAPLPLLTAAAAALALAACSSETPPAEPAPEPQPEAAVLLGGVDLSQPIRALGTEPFWGVDVTADALVYDGVDRPEQRASHDGPMVQGTMATWRGTTDQNQSIEVVLIDTDCSDGMSDRTYPLTARVVIGEETLNGCAALTSAIMTAGESGDLGA